MLSTLFQPCELSVNLIQNVIFLRPPQRSATDHDNQENGLPPLSNDELVRGLIHIYVPSSRHIDGIRVQMRATQSLALLDPALNYSFTSFENSTILEKTLEIGIPMRLSKLNMSRDQSTHRSRDVSASPAAYGGGGRSSEGSGVFKNMVRSVSRGRKQPEHSPRRNSSASLVQKYSQPHSRRQSPARVFEEQASVNASGSATPNMPPVASPISEDDLARVTRALHIHNRQTDSGDDNDEDRGRGRFAKGLHSGGSATPVQFPPDEDLRGKSSTVVFSDTSEKGLALSKGIHTFEFAFILPSYLPPYDRSPYGKVRYSVKVTALGAGRAKSNVEETRNFYPMVNPSPDGGMTPLSILFNDIHSTVGMLSVACTSNNISVGGLFNIDIHSPSPPMDLIVYMVRVSLSTTIELDTRKRGKQTVPVQKRKLYEQGYVPSQEIALSSSADYFPGYVRYAGTDDAWTVQSLARIPDDNAIRPSTMPGTRSSLRFHHVLVVEVVHSRDDPAVNDCLTIEGKRKIKVFTLRQNVIIPSCCCALDAVTLPAYSAKEPSHKSVPQLKQQGETGWAQILMANRERGESHNLCVCGLSLADLSAAERAMLPPPDPTDLLMDRVRHQGKIGELPEGDASGPGEHMQASTSGSCVQIDHPWRRTSATSTHMAPSSLSDVAASSSEARRGMPQAKPNVPEEAPPAYS
ncbi:hypothetical protein MVES1_002174 [Malassezia vespertilionis]|uniref:uncharacterized protein n=1 Tax=Malassezia vespertilionis TaxID=2020962 RepID=UPI0024B27593|nr:uncharacterized protein MVES1_002174 [Malassezia vespertilionis]WFD06820.1 hypothetical protein MVES1_002174 [Malassezia vespertilionis]